MGSVCPKKSADSSQEKPSKDKHKTGGTDTLASVVSNTAKITDIYNLDKQKIGEGSYGTVTKARKKKKDDDKEADKREYAVKAIAKAQMKNTDRFRTEIEIMKLMDHPNIIQLFETFSDYKNIYLVMELCDGGELFDKIIDETKFSEVTAAILMAQILRAIKYMHESSVCHRDLKPENFLFKNKEPVQTNILKIIDFGLSCEFSPDKKLTTKAGTPYYVAPEVLNGKYDHMSDMWSCGVIMYVLLCGYPPFFGDSDAEVLSKVREGNYQFSNAEWKNVSQDAKNLIASMLKKTVSERASASVALATTWITEKAPKATELSLDAAFVEKLRGFRSQNKLKKVAMNVIAKQLDDEHIKALRDMFTQLDTDDDGVLSIEELKKGIENCLTSTQIPSDLVGILETIDSNSSGSIEYREFIAATMERKLAEKEELAWQAFRQFDKDNNGKIETAELKQVLKDMGHDEEDSSNIMNEVDQNQDGAIDFDEFKGMMKNTKAKQ